MIYPPGWYGFSEDEAPYWLYLRVAIICGVLPDGTIVWDLAHPDCKPAFAFDGLSDGCGLISDGNKWTVTGGELGYGSRTASIEDRIGIRAAIWKFCRRTAREVLEIS
jgi:hypothetical protein